MGGARLGPLQAAKSKQSATPLELVSNSAAQTGKFGKTLGKMAAPGDVILMVGKLGTGKTCLTQGIAKGLDIDEYTPSPSFVLVREYQGRIPLYHIDLYRLDRLEEVIQLGLDDYLYGRGVSVVEWADRGLSALPEEHLLISIEHLATTKRRLTLMARGARYTHIVSKLKTKLESARK